MDKHVLVVFKIMAKENKIQSAFKSFCFFYKLKHSSIMYYKLRHFFLQMFEQIHKPGTAPLFTKLTLLN